MISTIVFSARIDELGSVECTTGLMQEHRIKPKCMPKTKETVGHAYAIKYIFVEML
jgi:hypothetical protein